jgi:hypothetical protein
VVGTSTFYDRSTEQLAALAARHAPPAIYHFREYALATFRRKIDYFCAGK